MVTVRGPMKRLVSIRARMAASSPGWRKFFVADALTQPHETRTPEMLIGRWLLFVSRNGWTRVGPWGTDPKSLDSSSNIASAQVVAGAGAAVTAPARSTRLYRNMVADFLRATS